MNKTHHSINIFILFESMFLLLSGGYLVYLRLTGALTYYIRPDYYLFTMLMGIVLVSAGILNIILMLITPKPYTVKWRLSWKDMGKLLIISFIIALGVYIPKKGLSSQTAFRRGPNQNTLSGQQALKGTKRDIQSLTTSPLSGKSISNNYTIADWMGLFQIDPEPESYEGKTVNVVGFVQPQQRDTFMVSRFVISCCIADATPIGLIVDRKIEDLKADDWIRVHGTFEVKKVNGNRQAVIKPDSIEKVTQPPEPYLY